MPKGIVRRTFLFAALLTTLVTAVSFCILYFAMPPYYQYKKIRDFDRNVLALVTDLQASEDEAQSVAHIRAFSAANNANVMSFGEGGMLLPAVSTPFIAIQDVDAVLVEDLPEEIAVERAGDVSSTRSFVITWRESGNDVVEADVVSSDESYSVRLATEGGDELYIKREVGSSIVHSVTVSGTLQPIDEAKGILLSLGPYALLASIAIGLSLAWVYARQISKPILRISDAAVRMQAMEAGALSGIRTDDELGELSRNLDALYDSLRASIGELRSEMDKVQRLEQSKTEMMQSASHELKTPVAALGGMLEGMIDGVGVYRDRDRYLAECRGQVEKLSRLVGEILSASRADAPQDTAPEEIDPGQLLRQALRDHAGLIEKKGLQVEQDLEPMTVLTGVDDLYRALSNLASNAVRYTPQTGVVRVAADAGNKTLIIENSCEAVPEEELEKLFEPFFTRSYSRDRESSGTGLGLYIVQRTLDRLGISLQVENSELGLRMTLYFQDDNV